MASIAGSRLKIVKVQLGQGELAPTETSFVMETSSRYKSYRFVKVEGVEWNA